MFRKEGIGLTEAKESAYNRYDMQTVESGSNAESILSHRLFATLLMLSPESYKSHLSVALIVVIAHALRAQAFARMQCVVPENKKAIINIHAKRNTRWGNSPIFD